jgi:hypothetical protein
MSLKSASYPNRHADILATCFERRLAAQPMPAAAGVHSAKTAAKMSAVLFLLTANDAKCHASGGANRCSVDGVHLLLNKRSPAVRQAGDLCCPGGGVTPIIDRFLGALLQLPRSPLTAWSQWPAWRRRHPALARRMALLFGTALREGLEEMGLNPLKLHLLGPLPLNHLVVFRREIYPFVAWLNGQRRFRLNWEVADLVYLPLAELLKPANYARLQYRFSNANVRLPKGATGETPCYLHRRRAGAGCEVLWGATFRITMDFLRLTFNFRPPTMEHLPLVERDLDAAYLNGP